MATILVAVGYYLAITQSSDPNSVQPADKLVKSSHKVAPLEVDDQAVDTSIRGVRFVYAPLESQQLTLGLRQDSHVTEGEDDTVGLLTQIELNFDETLSLRKAPADRNGTAQADGPEFIESADAAPRGSALAEPISPNALAAVRTYTDVRTALHTEQNGELGALGKGISTQVAELLEGSTTRTFLQPNGEPLGFEWQNVPNPEARRILLLVRDTQAFLTPRYTADALNPGDTWSYERPLWVDLENKKIHAEGSVSISNRFVGVLNIDGRHIGLIRQTLEGHADGKLGGDAGPTTFAMRGSGSGVFLIDIERGNRVAADLEFERILTIDDGNKPVKQSSKISLHLRPEQGLKLPERLRVAQQAEADEPAAVTP